MAETVEIEDAVCIRTSDSGKAVLIRRDDGKTFWVPQSLIHDDSEVWKPGDEGTLVVPEWWATQEGVEP